MGLWICLSRATGRLLSPLAFGADTLFVLTSSDGGQVDILRDDGPGLIAVGFMGNPRCADGVVSSPALNCRQWPP